MKTARTTLVVVALKEDRCEVIGTAHGTGEVAKAKQIADDWRAKNP